MDLSFFAKLATCGLIYIYVVKIIDTFWHGIFAHPVLSYSVVILNILAGISQLLFFIKLQSSVERAGALSSLASWLGVIGSLFNIFPKILSLLLLLQSDFLLNFIVQGQIINVLSPWLGANMLLMCCFVFSRQKVTFLGDKVRAFKSGAMGYFILVTAFSILVFNYFKGTRINWGEGETGLSHSIFIISASLAFLCIAKFYTSFFIERGNTLRWLR